MSTRAAALLAALKPAAPQEEETPECCCGKHAQNTSPKKTPQESSPPQLPCQCKDTQPTPLPSTARAADELVQLDFAFGHADIACAAISVRVDQEDQADAGPLVFPLGGARDILAAFHILRC
jgi:hypothetical protein